MEDQGKENVRQIHDMIGAGTVSYDNRTRAVESVITDLKEHAGPRLDALETLLQAQTKEMSELKSQLEPSRITRQNGAYVDKAVQASPFVVQIGGKQYRAVGMRCSTGDMPVPTAPRPGNVTCFYCRRPHLGKNLVLGSRSSQMNCESTVEIQVCEEHTSWSTIPLDKNHEIGLHRNGPSPVRAPVYANVPDRLLDTTMPLSDSHNRTRKRKYTSQDALSSHKAGKRRATESTDCQEAGRSTSPAGPAFGEPGPLSMAVETQRVDQNIRADSAAHSMGSLGDDTNDDQSAAAVLSCSC